jgi:two-component system LytT family response regulator
MRALLVDDETSARSRLTRLLAKFSDVEIVGQAQDGLEALSMVEATKPDVVFLDIRMPELDGFGVIRAIPRTSKMPLVIFATSYDDHALEAFETNAIAYLLKPIEPGRLALALDRARRLLGSTEERAEDEARVLALAEASKRLHRIVCRKGTQLLLFDPSEILWFYVEGGIVRAQIGSENYWVNYQLNQLEAGLDPALFFRSRREILVNLMKVKSIKPYDRSTFMLVMDDSQGTELLVSERQAKELRSRLPGL